MAITLHYKCVKASQLTREDIKSNPGPRNYAIKKALLASHHQGHSRYGDSAGMQCTIIAYFSIIYSAVKRVGLWKSLDLDIILAQGDELFQSVRINEPLAVDELPLTFSFEGHDISCQRLCHESHLFVDIDNLFENYRHYNSDQMGNGAIFTCGGFSFATIMVCELFFLFDSHNRNIDGFNDPNSRAVLFEFRTMMPLKNFIKSFFENCTGVSLETQHDLQYIGVQISDNLKEEILQSLQRKRKSLHNKVYQTKKKTGDPTSIFRQNQEYYPHNADRILSDRKQYHVNNLDKIRENEELIMPKILNLLE